MSSVHPTHWLISTQVPTIVDVSMLDQPVNMVSEKVPTAADLALFDGGAAASSCRWAWRIILPLSPSQCLADASSTVCLPDGSLASVLSSKS